MTASAPPTVHARDLPCPGLQACIKSGDGTVVYRGQLVEGYAAELTRRGAEHVRYCGWRGCVGDTPTLPAPPAGEPAWSIVTLAEHLCVPAGMVEAALDVSGLPFDGQTEMRHGASFQMATGSFSGLLTPDWYVDDAAVAHLLAAFPVGPMAREIVAAGEQYPGDPMHAMALHLVTHLGGGAA